MEEYQAKNQRIVYKKIENKGIAARWGRSGSQRNPEIPAGIFPGYYTDVYKRQQQIIKLNPMYWYITGFRRTVMWGIPLDFNMFAVCGLSLIHI